MKNPAEEGASLILLLCGSFPFVVCTFCKPVLDGEVLNQHDNIGWKGMAQNAFEYKERMATSAVEPEPLQYGMPNYQVAMRENLVLPDTVKTFLDSFQSRSTFSFLPVSVFIFFVFRWVLNRSSENSQFDSLCILWHTMQ